MSLDKSQYVSISKTSTTTVLLPAKNLRLYWTPVILLIDVECIYYLQKAIYNPYKNLSWDINLSK